MKTESWHAEFIDHLRDASDLEGQRAAWVERSTSHIPPPAELICQLFDDSGIDDLLAKGDVFSQATDAALKRLSTLVAKLDLDAQPGRLLSSPGWLEFAQEAARALALVRDDLAT